MKLYGLIGYPLSHSFSKGFFTEKFAKEGLEDIAYELFPIASIEAIEVLLGNPDLKGLNVTIPYKEKVLPYLSDVSNIPAGLNACNCIRITDGKTYGYNTDVTGFENAIIPHLKPHQRTALILGNGGAAKAVKYAFEKNNIAYKMVSRTTGSDMLTYAELTADIINEHLIIVNTTPLGMYPNIDDCPGIPYHAIGKDHYLFDLTYNPAETLFLKKGAAQGATVQNGLQMLITQAEESWRIWNE